LAVSAHSAVKVAGRRSYGVSAGRSCFWSGSNDLADIGCSVSTVAFKVYDMDRDGYISNGELYLVLKQMVGNNLKVRTLRDGLFHTNRLISFP
jgi:hypothetical protein